MHSSLHSRALLYISQPELILLFFHLRLARVYTLLFTRRIYLSTKAMRRSGVERFVERGRIYFEYKGGCYPETVANGNAVSHIKDFAVQHCTGLGLDIGSNNWPLPGAIAVDNAPNENAYKLDRWDDDSLDYIFSSHCLEHLVNWQNALTLWCSKLKIGGVLFLYLPHPAMTLWEPGSPWVGSDHVWSPSSEVLLPFLAELDMKILKCNPGPDEYFSFFIIAKRMH